MFLKIKKKSRSLNLALKRGHRRPFTRFNGARREITAMISKRKVKGHCVIRKKRKCNFFFFRIFVCASGVMIAERALWAPNKKYKIKIK